MNCIIYYRDNGIGKYWKPSHRTDTVRDAIEQFEGTFGMAIPFTVYEMRPLAEVKISHIVNMLSNDSD